jgi:hypothetical protein
LDYQKSKGLIFKFGKRRWMLFEKIFLELMGNGKYFTMKVYNVILTGGRDEET